MSYFGISIRNGLGLGLGNTPSLVTTPLSYRLAPSLNLQFAGAETLDSRITFTRTTTATFTGSDGLIQTAAIDAPRFDYNPVTLAPNGLLTEEQRINLVLNSATLVTQVVVVAAVAHTLSFYGTGTVTISGTFVGSLVGTGAYPTRSTLTFTPTAGAITLTVTGSVTLAQLEAGAYATSYIPTVASQVTRAADNAAMTGTNFSSWYNPTEGSFYVESQTKTTTGIIFALQASDNTYFNRVLVGQTTVSIGQVIVNNALTLQPTANLARSSAPLRQAFAFAANNAQFAANGVQSTPDTSGAMAAGLIRLDIGSDHSGFNRLVGWISRISYYPRRLANSEIQALTR
jgi:hypothetical protein